MDNKDNYYLYIAENEDLKKVAIDSLEKLVLGDDALSKHPPYEWKNTDVEKHLIKAVRHINTHLLQRMEYETRDSEFHLNNALTRLVMAIAIELEKCQQK